MSDERGVMSAKLYNVAVVFPTFYILPLLKHGVAAATPAKHRILTRNYELGTFNHISFL